MAMRGLIFPTTNLAAVLTVGAKMDSPASAITINGSVSPSLSGTGVIQFSKSVSLALPIRRAITEKIARNSITTWMPPHPRLLENALQISAGGISVCGSCRNQSRRGKHDREYELIDTGIFDEDRYFDIFVEYARINPTAVNMLVTVWNRGPDEATLHLLPQLWFRNTWSWKFDAKRPRISARNPRSVDVIHHDMSAFLFFVEKADECLFTEIETNARRFFGEDVEEYFKDARS